MTTGCPVAETVSSWPALGHYLAEERIFYGNNEDAIISLTMGGTVDWTYPDPEDHNPRFVLVDCNDMIYYSTPGRLVSIKPNRNPRWDYQYDTEESFLPCVHALTQSGLLLVSSKGAYMLRAYQGP